VADELGFVQPVTLKEYVHSLPLIHALITLQ